LTINDVQAKYEGACNALKSACDQLESTARDASSLSRTQVLLNLTE